MYLLYQTLEGGNTWRSIHMAKISSRESSRESSRNPIWFFYCNFLMWSFFRKIFGKILGKIFWPCELNPWAILPVSARWWVLRSSSVAPTAPLLLIVNNPHSWDRRKRSRPPPPPSPPPSQGSEQNVIGLPSFLPHRWGSAVECYFNFEAEISSTLW